MKNYALLAAGLALATVGASADEAQRPVPSVRLTTGGVVTTVALTSDFFGKKSTVRGDSSVYSEEKTVIKGNVHFENESGIVMTADQMTIQMSHGAFASIVLAGKATLQIQKDGKQVMQITADNATIEPA